VKVSAPDYSLMKREVLGLSAECNLRIVSGNGPIRVEGYKLAAFEMYEQLEGRVPGFIAVPTSACGHLRGIFKGYRELKEAGLTDRLPRMIIVQAANVNPVVSAIREGRDRIIAVSGGDTIAEAITSGDPPGGDEIILKARQYGWLAEDVTEEEILDAQRRFAGAGFFVEPAAATSLAAVKKLRAAGKIGEEDSVVLMLTGSGLKDMSVFARQSVDVIESDLRRIRGDVEKILARRGEVF